MAVALWDVADPLRPVLLGSTTTARQQAEGTWVPAKVSIAFTPEGNTMAIGTGDAAPTLWDVRDPWRPGKLGQRWRVTHRRCCCHRDLPGRPHSGDRRRGRCHAAVGPH